MGPHIRRCRFRSPGRASRASARPLRSRRSCRARELSARNEARTCLLRGRLPVTLPPRAMTIAGSDSGGGAGIQADLKTFQALGVYGTSTLTAITAQNTLGVRAVHEIPVSVIADQIDAVVEDIGVDATKTGMLSSAQIIATVADRVRHWSLQARLVVDPVMVAKSGDRLLREDAVEALRRELLPLAAVLTPNLPEAEVLVGGRVESEAEIRQAARAIIGLG